MQNQFYELFDLRKDIEQPHKIDQSIRGGVKVVGTNLWVLIFAILVASVGLNVNSTAVIIGAMLISPLMGPIVGIGYGAGINDFGLIKLSFRNLGIFTFISILSSTLYFTLSPLNTETPELLARTSPNLWDVLIAFFGGSAGIIALTRKSVSNVVPGVAIATALMPPLCTAGFGIAQGNWEYFGGAFFLYCINSVFIACSTWLFVKIFKLPKHTDLDESTAKRTNWVIAITILIMLIPSSYLAYNLVKQRSFTKSVESLISESFSDPDYVVLSHEIDTLNKKIHLTIGGENPPKNLEKRLEGRLASMGLADTNVIVRYSGSGRVDMSSLKNELRQDLYNNLQEQLNTLTIENKTLKTQLGSVQSHNKRKQELFAEIRAQYSNVADISITTGFLDASITQPDTAPEDTTEKAKPVSDNSITLVTITGENKLSDADKERISKWLAVRFKDKNLKMIFLDNPSQGIISPTVQDNANNTDSSNTNNSNTTEDTAPAS